MTDFRSLAQELKASVNRVGYMVLQGGGSGRARKNDHMVAGANARHAVCREREREICRYTDIYPYRCMCILV